MCHFQQKAKNHRCKLLNFDDTATKELDYLETTGTLTFIPGDKGPKQIEVTVIGDNLLESKETIRLNLTATNARKTNILLQVQLKITTSRLYL
jgi:hypothetical protein